MRIAVVFLSVVLAGCKLSAPAANVDDAFPAFPWPPPQASTQTNLPDELVRPPADAAARLADVDRRLSTALASAGYAEKSYYAVPDGFALVARLEQINDDGTPKSGPQRWAADVGPLSEFSLSAYLRALFTSNPGFFRVIVFVVTPHPFTQADVRISSEEATNWLGRGLNRLPASVGDDPFTNEHVCTALVYEFEKVEGEESTYAVRPSRLTATTHLEGSNIIDGLKSGDE